MEIIRELCSFEGRLAGTDAERRAAEPRWPSGCASSAGGSRSSRPTSTRSPRSSTPPTACSASPAAWSRSSIPALGFGLVAARRDLDVPRPQRAASTWSARCSSAARRRTSSPPAEAPDAPARLIICAHLDAARTGAVFAPSRARRFARLGRSARGPARPVPDPLLVAGGAASRCSACGWRASTRELVSVLQLLPTLVLLVGVFALVDIQLSRVVPGANDNASGVATAISLAGELERRAARATSTSGSCSTAAASACGGHARVRALAPQASSTSRPPSCSTIDSVGRGEVRFQTSAGLGGQLRHGPPPGRALRGDRDRRRRGRPALRRRPATRAGSAATRSPPRLRGLAVDRDHLPRRRRLRPPTATCPPTRPTAVDPAALDRAHDFALELIRRLDADLGRGAEAVIEVRA